MMSRIFFCTIIFLHSALNSFSQQTFRCNDGYIYFKSNASLEVIEAESNKLASAINIKDKTFAFIININSFEGFNGALQREHFNENYMETGKFKTAQFTGKIIEDIDFSKDSVWQVRAKGILSIHGVEQERIIKSAIVVHYNTVKIESEFTVLLKDHNIKVPKVVHEKIASEITVTVKAELKLAE